MTLTVKRSRRATGVPDDFDGRSVVRKPNVRQRAARALETRFSWAGQTPDAQERFLASLASCPECETLVCVRPDGIHDLTCVQELWASELLELRELLAQVHGSGGFFHWVSCPVAFLEKRGDGL